ncbi:MAG: hypothetical protein WBP33_14760 [Saprospiraceae bacterium]
MEIIEFNNQRFGSGDKVRYRDGNIYEIASLDFTENLIGLKMNISGGEPDDVTWVRYENVEYLG